MNPGDQVPLSCGHSGRVIWIRADGVMMGVRGSRWSCDVCSNGRGRPTVHLLPVA
jgi:hypothetical protein